MSEVLVDTSGWANFFVGTEPYHATALTIMRQCQQAGTQAITTNYVLAELTALFTSPLRVAHVHQVTYIETIKATSWVKVVHVDPLLDSEAWALFKARPDKDWNLVDCVSFVVMQERGITEALTADRHFEQAGFIRLLK